MGIDTAEMAILPKTEEKLPQVTLPPTETIALNMQDQDDPASIYARKLAEAGNGKPSEQDIWKELSEQGENSQRSTPWDSSASEWESRNMTAKDRIRRYGLTLRAKKEGVRDIKQFEQLVDYLESTVNEVETKSLELSQNLNETQREKLINQWKSKGWQGDNFNTYQNRDGDTVMQIHKDHPLELRNEDIGFLKDLMNSTDQDVVEMLVSLREAGMHLSPWVVKSEEIKNQLTEFLSSPRAKETLDYIKNVNNLSSNWFGTRDYIDGTIETEGMFSLVIEISNSENMNLDPQIVDKISTVSKALDMRVGAKEYREILEIVNNPDYLEFVSIVGEMDRSYMMRENVSYLDSIQALEQAGVLQPILELYRNGVRFDKEDSGDYGSPARAFMGLFEAHRYGSPQKRTEETVGEIKRLFEYEEVQEFLQNPEKREFVRVLSSSRGYRISIEEATILDHYFGEGLAKKEEAIYIIDLIDLKLGYASLENIKAILDQDDMMRTFVQPEFRSFLKTLQTEVDYKPSIYDFYRDNQSKIVNTFNNEYLRGRLLTKEALDVVRAIHPDGGIDFYNTSYYVHLSEEPNILTAIGVLRSLGYDFQYTRNLPDEKTLFSIARSQETIDMMLSPEFKDFVSHLRDQLYWDFKGYEIEDVIRVFSDKNIVASLYDENNIEYLKEIAGSRFSLRQADSMLELSSDQRNTLIRLVKDYSYFPEFYNSHQAKEQQAILEKIVSNKDLQQRLFSERTLNIYRDLVKNFGHFRLQTQDIESIASAPDDISSFIKTLTSDFDYKFNVNDIPNLISFSQDREKFVSMISLLAERGYKIGERDLRILNNLFKVADQLPQNLQNLEQIAGYKFSINDSQNLVSFIQENIDQTRLANLKSIYEKYGQSRFTASFDLSTIKLLLITEKHEDTIVELEKYNYQFKLSHASALEVFFGDPDKEGILNVLNSLNNNFSFQFTPALAASYLRLSKISGIFTEIDQAAGYLDKNEFQVDDNLRLFAILGGNASLYRHANELFKADYFSNIRDAQNRIQQFKQNIFGGNIPEEVVPRIFSLSRKATELDRLALQLTIDSEIAKATGSSNWFAPLMEAGNFEEAMRQSHLLMSSLAVPAIYSDLAESELETKKSVLAELASSNERFAEVMEICCRSVGIYGSKYPSSGNEYKTLMEGIKYSLELAQEADPQKYKNIRAELSKSQFDRLFESFAPELRQKVENAWLDLSSGRKLRISGSVVSNEEATLNRLQRIKDIITTDLSVHIETLVSARAEELQKAIEKGEAPSGSEDQIQIYKEFLIDNSGRVRQDIPKIYKSISGYIRDTQKSLKDTFTSKEDKARLGKSLGTYQAVSDSIKAIYKLGSISEERFKAKRDYLSEVDKNIVELSSALKRLKVLDPERRSGDPMMRAYEEELLLDLERMRTTMSEEGLSGQVVVETQTSVDFKDLARAPEMTQSCQRLTEVTGYNQAAYSRLIDGVDEMIDIFETKEGEKNRLGRSFIELSKAKLFDEDSERLVVLLDREYTNPQYQNFSGYFTREMVNHLVDRFEKVPEVSLLFSFNRFSGTEFEELLAQRGYKIREVSGQYFINESRLKLYKYYDSLGGINSVDQSNWRSFSDFAIIEKIPAE